MVGTSRGAGLPGEYTQRGPVLLPAKHKGVGVSAGHEGYVIEGMRDGSFKRAVITTALRLAMRG